MSQNRGSFSSTSSNDIAPPFAESRMPPQTFSQYSSLACAPSVSFDLSSPCFSSSFDSSTNPRMHQDAQQNLIRLQVFEENCNMSLPARQTVRGVIEQSYKAQVQSLFDELMQSRAEKAVLERKLQLISGGSKVNSFDGFSDHRLQNQTLSSSASLATELKESETKNRELQYQVQELTAEIKLVKLNNIQQKKTVETLQEDLKTSKQTVTNITLPHNDLLIIRVEREREKGRRIEIENKRLEKLLFG